MKNKIILIILCSISFLSATGCSDFLNWLGEDLKDFESIEDIQEEKERGNEIIILYNEDGGQDIETYEDSEPEKKDVNGTPEMYYENKRKHRYEDRELEKRDKEGKKTYWQNEQDSEF
jgi:hypothetical protein